MQVERAGAMQLLRPRTAREWKSLRAIALYVTLGFAIVIAFRIHQLHNHQNHVETWSSSVATIEDTRARPIGVYESTRGGGQAFQVEVLAAYTAQAQPQQHWLPVGPPEHSITSAKLRMSLLQGKQCFVRWNPSHPSEIFADIE